MSQARPSNPELLSKIVEERDSAEAEMPLADLGVVSLQGVGIFPTKESANSALSSVDVYPIEDADWYVNPDQNLDGKVA